MIDIKHVVCPVDLSACSRHALRYAFAWARWYQADVRVLHVVLPDVLLATPEPATVLVPRAPSSDRRVEVERFVADVAPSDVPFTIDVVMGDVTDEIVDASTRQPFSVVVMGTHGRSGLDRFLLGSVTARALHRVPSPTLVVPPDDEAAAGTAVFKRILCAVDFRPSSMTAFRYALSLAEEADAHLELLHVIPGMAAVAERTHAVGLTERDRRVRELALSEIEKLVPDDAREWCAIETQVIGGAPAPEIARRATETGAQLIVMGSGERHRLQPAWLGLTTDRITRIAPCPVLVVPGRREAHD